MTRIKNLNLVLTGSFLILVALLALHLASPLATETTDSGMGPGYVPRMFGIAQLALGGLLVFNGFMREGQPTERWHLRPLVLVLGSVAFFAISIERMGLIVSVTGLVLISCAAHRGTTWREALLLAAGCSAVSALLFVKLLGLAIALWPPMSRGA
jgi:putative tricarboxylic transport membrane protein